MKIDQFVGPFTSNLVLNRRNVTYLQIGIEHPHSIPLTEIEEDDGHIQWPLVVGINKGQDQPQHDFVITEEDTLELELKHELVTVTIYENKNPYLIVNVAYEDAN